MSLNKIKQLLHMQKNRIGLVSGAITLDEFDETEHPISACIDPKNWNIKLEVQAGYEPVKDETQKKFQRLKNFRLERKGLRKISSDGLETLLEDITLHECTHWEAPVDSGLGCPYDTYNHDKILEAVKQTLPEGKKQHAGYLTNAFEDILVNTRANEFQGDFSGQVLFWDNEGLNAKGKGQENFTPIYEAFVKLNMHLWGDAADRGLLKRHYSENQEVEKAVEKTIQELSLEKNIQDSRVLFDKKRWPKMARIFAKNMIDLIDETPQERLSAYSPEAGEDSEEQSGNGFDEKMKTGEGKEEIASGRYASKEGQSTNMTSFENLSSLYRRLARDIPVHVEAMTREQVLDIASLNYRSFDPEIDDPTKAKLSKIFITDQGLRFGHRDQPLTITAKSKIQRRSFPDFKMIIMDDSGSMQEAPDGTDNIGSTDFIPWGDNSKYHYALLGKEGVENFLQKQGISQYIRHGLSLFSSDTRYHESDFMGLDEQRKKAYSPKWGGTHLDASILEQALSGRESFVLSVSDGEVTNWGSEKDKIKRMSEGNNFAHIQIGGETRFSQDLESWEIPVYYVSSGKDLSKLMVEVTQSTYKKFYQEVEGGNN